MGRGFCIALVHMWVKKTETRGGLNKRGVQRKIWESRKKPAEPTRALNREITT